MCPDTRPAAAAPNPHSETILLRPCVESAIASCQTRLNQTQTEVQLPCLQIRHPSWCMAAYLATPQAGQRNPRIHRCRGSYKPLDTPAFTGAITPFHLPSGLVHDPLGASQPHHSVVMLRTYQPQTHFTRTLTIPNIQLAGFTAQQ